MVETKRLKDATRGRWPHILPQLGITVPSDPKRHAPCPACGGRDRFRFDDLGGAGTWYCNQCDPHAGDGFDLVKKALNLDFREAAERIAAIVSVPVETAKTIEATYPYHSADGQLLFEVMRYKPKDFRQRRPNGRGGWIYDLKGIAPVLFHLPDVLAAESVLVLEGEKDVETAYRLGLPDGWAATCNAMGAGKWKPSYSECLRGKDVVLCPDTDEPGIKHGHLVAADLNGIAERIDWLTLPDGRKDLSDWAAGKSQSAFHELLTEANPYAVDQPDTPVTRTAHPWTNSLLLVRTKPPEAVWLLEGIIPAQSVVLFSGREGSMKSWLAMDWAASIAEGRPWLGREAEAGSVLYLDAEMPGDLLRGRIFAVGASANLNVWTWQHETFTKDLEHPAMLLAAQEHKLIVVDTLRRFLGTGDENSANDMAIITAKIRTLTKWGATVLLLHHATKDKENGGYRGSTELGASVDIALHIEKRRDAGETHLVMDAFKTRYSADPKLVIKVDETLARPLFHDITGTIQQAKTLAKEQDFTALVTVITGLIDRDGRHPSQTELIEGAMQAGQGSRNTILSRLREGEGRYWDSYLTGRTRAYRLPTCPSFPLEGDLDRLDKSEEPVQPVQRGIAGTIGQVEEVNLDH